MVAVKMKCYRMCKKNMAGVLTPRQLLHAKAWASTSYSSSILTSAAATSSSPSLLTINRSSSNKPVHDHPQNNNKYYPSDNNIPNVLTTTTQHVGTNRDQEWQTDNCFGSNLSNFYNTSTITGGENHCDFERY